MVHINNVQSSDEGRSLKTRHEGSSWQSQGEPSSKGLEKSSSKTSASATADKILLDVTMMIFSLLGAMSETVTVQMEVLSDAINAVTQMMGVNNNLIGPQMNKWSTYFQQQLSLDQGAIGNSDDKNLAKEQAKFNEDNTTATAGNTGFGNASSMVSQQIQTLNQTAQNSQSQAQQFATSLVQSISADWVIT